MLRETAQLLEAQGANPFRVSACRPALKIAAHDGRPERVAGVGPRRAAAANDWLAPEDFDRLGIAGKVAVRDVDAAVELRSSPTQRPDRDTLPQGAGDGERIHATRPGTLRSPPRCPIVVDVGIDRNRPSC